MTVGEFLDGWLKAVEPSIRPSTYRGYEIRVRVHLVPSLGHIPLQKLQPLHLQALYAEKLEQGLSKRSVRYIHDVLHMALKKAVKWGYLARDVSEVVDLPKEERKEMAHLTPEEAVRVLEAARDECLYALLVLALTTGMRQGELLALKWEDVDLVRGTVTVRRGVQWIGAKPVIAEPKNRSSYRTIPLCEAAARALKSHRKTQAEEKLLLGAEYEDQGLLFATKRGTIINKDNLSKRFLARIFRKAGVRPVRFHDLRHTAATLLLAEGAPIKNVQAVLGHSTATMTLDKYGHLLPDRERETARIMDRIISTTSVCSREIR